MLSSKLPLALLEFLNTRRNARKNIQYSIAIKTSITINNILPKIHNTKEKHTASKIHKMILNTAPTIPSPISTSSKSRFEK
jgi:hypothetical protein